MQRTRLRNLGLTIGALPPGPLNAITDVAGVWVGHKTLIYDEPRVARTGVTVLLPRGLDTWRNHVFSGFHSFNGNGEMTGLPWLVESGMVGCPIGITNTHQVGLVRDALVAYAVDHNYFDDFMLPVVAETYDGWLNDINAFHLTQADVYEALDAARSGPVAEGNVGGGTGMICHGFKGGIGTASRVVESQTGTYTVGVLVQANYGSRKDLRVEGVPVGREIDANHTPPPWPQPQTAGSIIIIVATDAPLLPVQCKRLAQRATVGLARVGGLGYNGSGDIFMAFATGNTLPANPAELYPLQMVPHHHLNLLFEGTVEATEEAILNALTAAETMVGWQGRVVHALPLEALQGVMAKYRP
jgi:D-aminopeptidase